ncbi:MAG: outer membrane lipoprotein carrier protein LolA [Thermoanaerobaculales bacterium]
MRRSRAFVFLMSVFFTAPLWAGPPAPADRALDDLEGSAKLHALIDRVVERQRALTSMTAGFVQTKHSALLLEATESSGQLSYRAPDAVRWDYSRPEKMVVLFAGDAVTTYHPGQARAERLKISKKQRRFVRALAGMQPLDDLTSHFKVSLADPGGEAPYRLTLRPVGKMIGKRLRSIKIEVDRRLLLPVAVEYNEADGDSTRFEFYDLVIDPTLDDERFLLEFDAGVRVETLDASAGVG